MYIYIYKYMYIYIYMYIYFIIIYIYVYIYIERERVGGTWEGRMAAEEVGWHDGGRAQPERQRCAPRLRAERAAQGESRQTPPPLHQVCTAMF